MSSTQKHAANVFLPGCIGPLRRTVVLEDDYDTLAAECQGLREALEEIAQPVRFMRKRLQQGELLNGLSALNLSNDAEYLKGIARAALAGSKEGE